MQELTQQAQQTLGRELGNSGTVDRGLAALALRNPAAAAGMVSQRRRLLD